MHVINLGLLYNLNGGVLILGSNLVNTYLVAQFIDHQLLLPSCMERIHKINVLTAMM